MSSESTRVLLGSRELVSRNGNFYEPLTGKPVELNEEQRLALQPAPPATRTAITAVATPAKPQQPNGPRLGYIAQQVAASA